MAGLVITRPLIPGEFGKGGQPKNHPKMQIVAEGKKAFTVPYAPRETTHDGFVPVFTTVDRGGREPLLLRAGGTLETMSFELTLGHTDWNQSIETALKQLTELAQSGARMRVKLDDPSGSKRWRLTSFSYNVTMRQQGTNAATRATAQLTFTAASDPVVEVGPVSGGKKGGKSDDGKWPKFYVFKKGDTLHSVANKFYGDPSQWSVIADANQIRNPKTIKPGRKLRIPKPPASVGWVPSVGWIS